MAGCGRRATFKVNIIAHFIPGSLPLETSPSLRLTSAQARNLQQKPPEHRRFFVGRETGGPLELRYRRVRRNLESRI